MTVQERVEEICKNMDEWASKDIPCEEWNAWVREEIERHLKAATAGAQSREGQIDHGEAMAALLPEDVGCEEYVIKARARIADIERHLAEANATANNFARIAEAEREAINLKDRGKTAEINLLVAENRALAAALKDRGVDVGELMPRSFKATADRIAAIVDAASVYVGHRVSAGGIDEWLKELGADELYEAVRAQEEANND